MEKVGSVPTIYNVCSGESVSIKQSTKSAMSIININLPTIHQPYQTR
jgi:hypothetical protein